MTPTEMEDALKNLDRRLSAVEQFLPTVATRQDLLEAFETARRHTDILIDDVRDDVRKVAEGVATLTMVVQDMGTRFERRFEAMDRRFEAVDARFEAVDARFDLMDRRFDAMDRRFDAMDRRFDAMDRRFDAMDGRFDAMDGRFDAMDHRLDTLTVRVERVEDRLPPRYS